jgi:hypothetical protein
MSRLRALAFVCFMVSIAGLSMAKTQAASEFKCGEDACDDIVGCADGCFCTCDGTNPYPDDCGGWHFGWCAVEYSTE